MAMQTRGVGQVLICVISFFTPLAIGQTQVAAFSPDEVSTRVQRSLTFEERIAHQYAIEEVYWRHRIWPKENNAPKPSFASVTPREETEEKVAEYLKLSRALEDYWQRPLTAQQLQAEVDRMTHHSKQPEVLRELFAALNNDPFLIAECLARPALAERLARSYYSHDERFHGELKHRAEVELAARSTVDLMKQTGPRFTETEFVNADSLQMRAEPARPNEVRLSTTEFEEAVKNLAVISGSVKHEAAGILSQVNKRHLEAFSELQEDGDRYYAAAILNQTDDRLKVATVEWRKEPFDFWRHRELRRVPDSVIADYDNYKLPILPNEPASNDDTWSATNGVPTARDGHIAVWTGSEMIIWGGSPGSSPSTGSRYDPTIDSWTAITVTNAPLLLNEGSAVWTGREMIVWGGYGSPGAIGTGGKYNPITDTWVATSTTNAPSGRHAHTAVWTGREMIIWGGFDFATSNSVNTGGRYDPATDTWTATGTTNAPYARAGHTAVWSGSEMIIWGGSGGLFNTSGGRYNPVNDSWTSTGTANAPMRRFRHTAVWTGSEMIVWGGSDGNNEFNTGGRYNPAADSWVATPTLNAPAGRQYHTAIWTDTEMIVWGGGSGTGSNTGGRYNPASGAWVATTTINAPSARLYHTAVWSGREMIIWGGANTNDLNTGSRYDPSNDSWIATTTANLPAARSTQTAVWTGSEMIVWGGGSSGLNTGGRYNPAIDTWQPTSVLNAPSARHFHSAIWSGYEMIIWGGLGSNYLNTGARYNPVANTWTATTTSNAPVIRGYHVAVWTGSRMIVWGGYSNGAVLNTGGTYDPAADSWTATSTLNAPETRSDLAAVWTGTEMIVWGGHTDNNAPVFRLNTGGRYNPTTDSWRATSTATAPPPRIYHTAVWTGNEMIVWGGYDGYNLLNTGWRYDPGADAWLALSNINAPPARYRHTTVWTGSEMIAWGGQGSSSSTLYNGGGRYSPATNTWRSTDITHAPTARYDHTAIWTGSQMIVWGGTGLSGALDTGARYGAEPAAGIVQSAVSRKVHGGVASYDVSLPLVGAPGVECRSRGATGDYTIVVTFLANVSIAGNPQARVTSGAAIIGSGGIGNGGMVVTAANVVMIPVTNVTNAQTIEVTLNAVNQSSDIVIPMTCLLGDVNGDGSVNSADATMTRNNSGQLVNAANFRTDLNLDGAINSADATIVRSLSGSALPTGHAIDWKPFSR